MFIVTNGTLAIVLCVITMLCWGSWGNTQKLASKSWRYELFYWDYCVGILLFSLLMGLTLGSNGEAGRPFLEDLCQLEGGRIASALLGGVIFNAANILLTAAVSISGLAIAWPIGLGIALVLGVVLNYFVALSQGAPTGNAAILAIGVALVLLSVICNGVASGKKGESGISKADQKKGIILAVCAGLLMSFFSSFVMRGMGNVDAVADSAKFAAPYATPYTASVIFTLGVLLSNFLFNTIVMKKPFVGEPVTYKQYFAGNAKTHLVGMLGGAIWCLGTALSYITSKAAGPAISYALGQGAPMIAAIWGVFVWKEFKGSGKNVYTLLGLMFLFFIVGLSLIVLAGM